MLGWPDDPQYPGIVPTKNFTCGLDAWKPNHSKTLTADVVAGSEIGLRILEWHAGVLGVRDLPLTPLHHLVCFTL